MNTNYARYPVALDTGTRNSLVTHRKPGRPLGAKDVKMGQVHLSVDEGVDVYSCLAMADEFIKRAIDQDVRGAYIPERVKNIFHKLRTLLSFELDHIDSCIDARRECRRRERTASRIVEDYWKKIEAKEEKCSVWK